MPVSAIAVGMGGVLWITDNSCSAVSSPKAIRLSPSRPPSTRWRSNAASMSSRVTKPRPTSNPPKLMTKPRLAPPSVAIAGVSARLLNKNATRVAGTAATPGPGEGRLVGGHDLDRVFLNDRVGKELLAHRLDLLTDAGGIGFGKFELDQLALAHPVDPAKAECR